MKADLLIATYAYILPRKDEFATEFYSQLFVRSTEAYNLFTYRNVNMRRQKNLLMSTLFAVVTGAKDDPHQMLQSVSRLGERHQSYGVSSEFYDIVGEVLIDTFQTFLKDAWTPEKEATWIEAYTLLKKTMLAAYK